MDKELFIIDSSSTDEMVDLSIAAITSTGLNQLQFTNDIDKNILETNKAKVEVSSDYFATYMQKYMIYKQKYEQAILDEAKQTEMPEATPF